MDTSRDIGSGPVRERHSAAGGASGGAHRPATRQLIAREWKALREDPPGERFRNHHRRMRDPACRTLRIAALAVGPILAAAGVIMLFIPGPGLLFIVAGVALLCGQSERLAGWLDRREPELRRALAGVQRRWRTLRPRP